MSSITNRLLAAVGLVIVLASPALRRFIGGWLGAGDDDSLAGAEGSLAPANVKREPARGNR